MFSISIVEGNAPKNISGVAGGMHKIKASIISLKLCPPMTSMRSVGNGLRRNIFEYPKKNSGAHYHPVAGLSGH